MKIDARFDRSNLFRFFQKQISGNELRESTTLFDNVGRGREGGGGRANSIIRRRRRLKLETFIDGGVITFDKFNYSLNHLRWQNCGP